MSRGFGTLDQALVVAAGLYRGVLGLEVLRECFGRGLFMGEESGDW